MSSRISVMAMLVAAWMFLISPPAQAAKGKRVARSYSVAQILSYVAQTDVAKAENSDNEGKPGATAEDKLIDLIVSTVQPDSWQPNGGRGKISYEPASKSLVIHQTPAVHDEIANLLAALARLMDVQVAIEIRVLSVSEACIERLRIHLEPAATTKECEDTVATTRVIPETIKTSEGLKAVLPAFVTEVMPIPTDVGKAFFTDSQVRELLEFAQGDRRTNIMQAPKLVVLNGQTGVVEITDTQYFVTRLNLDCKGGQLMAKPTQEAIKLGICMTVLPTVSADRKSVLVNLKFKNSTLAGPVPLIPIQIPIKRLDNTGKEKAKPELFTLFLQQPQVSTLAIDNTTVIPEGQTLLLGGVKKLTEERNEFGPPILSKIPYLNRIFKTVGYGRETVSLVIMVTPRIVVREEEEQSQGGDQSIPQP